MAHVVKEASYISIHHIIYTSIVYLVLDFLYGIMASSVRSETIHTVQKSWLINSFQYFLYCQLHNLVLIGSNPQRTFLAICFRYEHPK